MTTASLSHTFTRFADQECKHSSPLYDCLAREVAADLELLTICLSVPKGQPVPNLFFGAVHYLLYTKQRHELHRFYRSFTDKPEEAELAFNSFKQFCLSYSQELAEILTSRYVQTNEVRRTAYLFPVFQYIQTLAKKPLALIEIGTSAGLQLLVDRFTYTYNDNITRGAKHSLLTIPTEVKDNHYPNFSHDPLQVFSKIGVDINVMNVREEDDYLWLVALIWPEHVERRDIFKLATEYMQQSTDIELIEGDGVELLLSIAKAIPQDEALCIFHTHVANQMNNHTKDKLLINIETIAKERDVYHVYNNMQDKYLHLDYFLKGEKRSMIIAETEGHGKWFTWLLSKEHSP